MFYWVLMHISLVFFVKYVIELIKWSFFLHTTNSLRPFSLSRTLGHTFPHPWHKYNIPYILVQYIRIYTSNYPTTSTILKVHDKLTYRNCSPPASNIFKYLMQMRKFNPYIKEYRRNVKPRE